MSRKDFIVVAEACVNAINSGAVKKSRIDSFVQTMCDKLSTTNSLFSYTKFENFVKERIKQ